MATVETFLAMLPPHEASLHLEHNQHKAYHQTVKEWERDRKACSSQDGASPTDFGWVSDEERRKAIAADSVWELQWYPHTPIGFHRLLACDLAVLLEAAAAGGEDEG